MSETLERQASELNIELSKGSDLEIDLLWRSGDGDINSKSPSQWPPLVDTTGFSAEFKMRPIVADDDVDGNGDPSVYDDIILDSASGRIVLGATLGQIQLTLLASETVLYNWDRATYNLLIKDATGGTDILAFGRVRAFDTLQEVTPR